MKKFFYLFLLLCGTFTLEATTITVTSGADAGTGTLRDAISSAVAGDDIVFSGVTTVTLTSAELVINKNLTINGGIGVTVTRSAAINFRIFNILGAVTTVVFNKLSITNGKAAVQAGGIQNVGNLTLNDCIIANNESAVQGGGLQNDGILTMNRCVVHNNKASTSNGGGLLIYSTMTTTLNNCVFTNTLAGRAIDIQSNGTLNITNCTIAKNAGGGINIELGSVTLKNTIVAENTSVTSPNINKTVSANSAYNLLGTEGGNGGLNNGTNNNLVGISPQFANSSDPDGADNIFGTADDGLRLTACNFATNAGNNADAPAGTDIVGNPRIFNTTVDMGAYEFQANSTPLPSLTLGTIPAILAGATTFKIPYTAPIGSPTTYSISGTGITTATDAALPSSPITVNLTAAASINLSFSMTVKNANGCTSTSTLTGSVTVVQSVGWTGAISSDWSIASNWSPNFVPTATLTAVVNDVANDPIILSGTTAVAKEIYINKNALLKVNSGGILNVNVTTVSNNITLQGPNSSLTNEGTINVGTGSGFGISAFETATLTNRGTINTNNGNGIVAQPSGNFTFTNESTGVVNGDFRSGSILNLTNRGTINYAGGNGAYVFNFNNTSSLVNEGTIKITAGNGISNPTGGIITNNACGKILMSAGDYTNGGTTTNAGLLQITNLNNTGGTFTNTGVLKYGTLTGTVTSNQNSSVNVRNLTYPIFAYGGTFSGTINGIFTDTLATVSAGTFTTPFAFTPLATLPRGIQTLYAKITNGACTYVVPFSYNTLTSSIAKTDAQTVALHQNRPNPFSQQTIVSFNLMETDKAVLTVYDINGRQVFMSNQGFKTGYNEVVLNKSVFQTTGTYFYRLTTDKFSTVKRLQFIVE